MNDRSPFGQERRIDLWFAAGWKLDMAAIRTARVEVVALDLNERDREPWEGKGRVGEVRGDEIEIEVEPRRRSQEVNIIYIIRSYGLPSGVVLKTGPYGMPAA